MKINFNKKMNSTADFLLKRCGYGHLYDRRSGKESYAKRFGRDFYPRFHLYVNSEDPLILNLHIDQKRASYAGHTAHSGEYEGPLVEQEASRIYQTINSLNQTETTVDDSDKKSIWQKIFKK